MLPMTLMILTNINQDLQKHLLKVEGRYGNHISSFNNEQHENKTELSKYIWSFKNENKTPIINQKIMKKFTVKQRQNFVNYV